MKELVKNNNSGKIEIIEIAPPQLLKGGVLVQTDYSVLSVGTELASIEIAQKSLIEKARERPEDLKKVISLAKKEGWYTAYKRAIERLETPSILGYSSSGTVIEVCETVKKFRVGDLVACGGNKYAGHAEIISVPSNLCVKIPNEVKSKHAAFTTIGSIAIQAVRQSKSQLGENVLIIGLGLVGQLTAQILKASGCNPIGIDIDKEKVKFTKNFLKIPAFTRDESFKSEIENLTSGYGFDNAIITAGTKSNDPVEMAIDLLRDRGSITVVGQVSMNIDWSKAYHKEITVNLSRSYGPGRYDANYEEKGIDYPIGYVRWTEKRNMESFLDLIKSKKIVLDKLISKTYDFSNSVQAYKDLMNDKKSLLGIVFDYNNVLTKKLETIHYKEFKKTFSDNKLKVGFIGAGNYSKAHLLPNFIGNNKIIPRGICTLNGRNSDFMGKKYNFDYSTSKPENITNDDNTDLVIISTRHDSHHQLVIDSLNANKHVFVEKPLAINREGLESIVNAYESSKGSLMLGYNRRFSSLTLHCLKFLRQTTSPLMINYRISAESLPSNHWFYDKEIGGGRISSELCHFIDYCNFIAGKSPTKLFVANKVNGDSERPDEDSLIINILYSDGSIANIFYISEGSKKVPKERIEIYKSDKTLIIDNFIKLDVFDNATHKRKSLSSIDKGQKTMIKKYISSILENKKSVIDFESINLTTIMTLDAMAISSNKNIKEYNFQKKF